jgi:hypothetical protein
MAKIHGSQIESGTITQAILGLVDPVGNLDAVTKQFLVAYVQNSMNLQNWKSPVKAAIGTNVNLATPGATIDGIAPISGTTRFLLFGQTTASQNGVYIWNGAAAPMTRATDFDADAEAIDGAAFPIQEGTFADKFYKLTTNGTITLGTTALTFQDIIPTTAAIVPTIANKDMAASATTADFDLACATVMVGTPGNDGYVKVEVNGVGYAVGDGVKTKPCYFSADSGATAKSIAAIATGDRLYWVGSVAGFQLLASFKLDFHYNL